MTPSFARQCIWGCGRMWSRKSACAKRRSSPLKRPCRQRKRCSNPAVKKSLSPSASHSLKFTNLNKVFYPAEGIVKRDLLNYYDAVADLILPHLKDRPLSLKRYPNGITQQFFFQKDAPLTFAPWLRTEEIYSDHNEAPIRYVFAQDRASLLYLVNLGCIDHNPWMSRSPTLDNPDFVLIDLDPQDCPFDMIVEAALLVRDKLQAIGLAGYPKTTGGDGMHVYIPLEPIYSYEESRTFAELLSHLVVREQAELVHHAADAFRSGKRAACISIGCRTANPRPSPRRMCCERIPVRPWPRRSIGAR